MTRLALPLTILLLAVVALGVATVDGLAQSTPNTHLTPERLAEIEQMMAQPR